MEGRVLNRTDGLDMKGLLHWNCQGLDYPGFQPIKLQFFELFLEEGKDCTFIAQLYGYSRYVYIYMNIIIKHESNNTIQA